ncbi:MAG: hypothetical protein HPY59_00610 [Anaerolineae bacterium]|nr:hypothetical protein [Anaerolineae bacterium]
MRTIFHSSIDVVIFEIASCSLPEQAPIQSAPLSIQKPTVRQLLKVAFFLLRLGARGFGSPAIHIGDVRAGRGLILGGVAFIY